MRIQFRVPFADPAPTIDELLARAWPEGSAAQRAQLFEASQVRIDERISRNPHRRPDPDLMVEVEVPAGEETFGLPEADVMSRGEGWLVVRKATGMPGSLTRDDPMSPVLFLADMLGLDRDLFTPVWEMPTMAGGPWLVAEDPDYAARLEKAWQSGKMMMTWVALTPQLPIARGQFESKGVPVDYGVSQIGGGLCEVQLTPQFHEGHEVDDPVAFLRELLAAEGAPVLGDRDYGGYMVAGGLRLRLAALFDEEGEIAYSWPPSQEGRGDWWPKQPVVAVQEPAPDQDAEGARPAEQAPKARGIQPLQVSDKTIEVLTGKGHPWVLADRDTGSRDHLRPGTLVRLRGKSGKSGPYALVEGSGELAARVWSFDDEAARAFDEEIDLRVDEAMVRRGALLKDLGQTDLFRMIHAEADGLPGLLLDRVGPLVRATVVGEASAGFRRRVYENLVDFDPDTMLLEVRHTTDVRQGELPQASIVHGGAEYVRYGERVIGHEDGLRYLCEPWEGIDTGFFADQRENRRRLAELAEPGQRWLNLFCHTGAFTVRLVDAGCEVDSVDISRRYLDWLEENLAVNELPAEANRSFAEDARRFLKEKMGGDRLYDGIIVDPPTAASGEGGFWSVRKDYEALLALCFERLSSEGTMLVCRNDRRRKRALSQMVETAADKVGRRSVVLENAPPAGDYPPLPGFPEGDSFEGLLARFTSG